MITLNDEFKLKSDARWEMESKAFLWAGAKARGMAEGLLQILKARGIEVPESAESRITKCSNRGQIRVWLERAMTAESIDDVLGDRDSGGSIASMGQCGDGHDDEDVVKLDPCDYVHVGSGAFSSDILRGGLMNMLEFRPALAADLISELFGMPVPEFRHARLAYRHFDDDSLRNDEPTFRFPDRTAVLSGAWGAPVLAVPVYFYWQNCGLEPTREANILSRYLASVQAQLNCPAVLLVACADELGSSSREALAGLGESCVVLSPPVLRPEAVLAVNDAERSRRVPELVILSAMAYGAAIKNSEVLDAVVCVLDTVDFNRAAMYADILGEALPHTVWSLLEARMVRVTYDVRSEFLYRFRERSRAEGAARAILAVLAKRGVDVPADLRAHIAACRS
ncbi:hypothetical protein, partial [Phytoactinopolyspora endophytica]|uniref:hypothetical protein n=1 Tax=Phytoactinopolyspora endophytica TaxID=1642495 RepID=UPI0013EAFBDE